MRVAFGEENSKLDKVVKRKQKSPKIVSLEWYYCFILAISLVKYSGCFFKRLWLRKEF